MPQLASNPKVSRESFRSWKLRLHYPFSAIAALSALE
jgi:hypothetical protein